MNRMVPQSKADGVLASLGQAFPDFPAKIEESVEDCRTLLVFVFNVPSLSIDGVEDFILALQDEIDPELEHQFVPMVKTCEVTAMHFPEAVVGIRLAAMLGKISQMCGNGSYTIEWGAASPSDHLSAQGAFPAGHLPEEGEGFVPAWRTGASPFPAMAGRDLPLAA